ncbi:MAG: DUF1874 domain-containing protein [Syntrophales bacterium]|jgi:hypothetical protein|nr:DUF1874 domain-containing protein [Syntrophales bacterium]
MAKYIFNTPVLTNYGVYRFEQLTLAQAKVLASGALSAVGHKGAAEALSFLLGIEIKTNRVTVKMEIGDEALVFRLLQRLPEGAVLSREDTLKSFYEFGRLERLS